MEIYQNLSLFIDDRPQNELAVIVNQNYYTEKRSAVNLFYGTGGETRYLQ